MKKIKILLSTVVLMSVASCSDFLSEVPDNRTQLDSAEKIAELLVNAYPKAVPNYFTDAMSDNFGDSKRVDKSELDNTAYYLFNDFDESELDAPAKFWEASYTAIAHANQAIDAIAKHDDPKSLEHLKGEALLTRAYNHFMLVNIYAQTYDPATASSEIGVPVVEDVESTLIVNYKRASVQEVYDAVERDLLEGLPLVKDRSVQKGYHFTRASARAFASKFYLFKADWDKVVEYSDELGDAPVNRLRVSSIYKSLPFQTAFQEYGNQSQPANLLLSAGNSVLNYHYGFRRFGMTKDLRAQIWDSPSYNVFNKRWNYRVESYQGYDNSFVTKYYAYFIMEGGNTTSGQPYATYVLLSTDEWYLNRIEALVMKGELDRAAKMMAYFTKFKTLGYTDGEESRVTKQTVLNLSKSKDKYEPFYTIGTDDQKAFIDVVSEMRRRELVMEGSRWLDIKRYNLEVIHMDNVTNQEHKLEKRDLRKAIQLPSHVAQYGVELNKR